jgi:hypothetical protein
VQRIRLTFAKDAPLRFIGHLDLGRAWERAFRRARLPLAYTLGFTPHPRLTFAAPLALGATGEGELLDIYLREEMKPDELVHRLAEQLPQGLRVAAAKLLPAEGPSLTSLTRWAEYLVEASPASGDEGDGGAVGAMAQGSRWAGRPNREARPADEALDAVPWRPQSERLPPPEPDPPLPSLDELRRRVVALLAAETLPRTRVRDGKPMTYDLRPQLLSLSVCEVTAGDGGRAVLGMTVRLDSTGTARPDEVCAALGLRPRAVHRVRIGLEGESPT